MKLSQFHFHPRITTHHHVGNKWMNYWKNTNEILTISFFLFVTWIILTSSWNECAAHANPRGFYPSSVRLRGSVMFTALVVRIYPFLHTLKGRLVALPCDTIVIYVIIRGVYICMCIIWRECRLRIAMYLDAVSIMRCRSRSSRPFTFDSTGRKARLCKTLREVSGRTSKVFLLDDLATPPLS